jgi:hypothetical protein
VPITKKHKLGSTTVDCVFPGYAIHSVDYRFLIVKSGVPDMYVGTIMKSRDARMNPIPFQIGEVRRPNGRPSSYFFENIFPIRDETSSSRQEIIEKDISTKPIVHNEFTLMDHPDEDNNEPPRKSKK